MSVTLNTQAMKYRETTADEWAPVTIHTDAEVNAVVQDTEPTGNENVWFDTSDESEVVVPTMNDLGAVENTVNVLRGKYSTFVIPANGNIELTNLPASYIISVMGYSSAALSVIIGCGYGEDSAKHHIAQLLSATDITYSVLTDRYGIKISNSRNYEVSGTLFSLV